MNTSQGRFQPTLEGCSVERSIHLRSLDQEKLEHNYLFCSAEMYLQMKKTNKKKQTFEWAVYNISVLPPSLIENTSEACRVFIHTHTHTLSITELTNNVNFPVRISHFDGGEGELYSPPRLPPGPLTTGVRYLLDAAVVGVQATPHTLLPLPNQSVEQRAAVVAPGGLVVVGGLEHVRGAILGGKKDMNARNRKSGLL